MDIESTTVTNFVRSGVYWTEAENMPTTYCDAADGTRHVALMNLIDLPTVKKWDMRTIIYSQEELVELTAFTEEGMLCGNGWNVYVVE